MREVKIVDIGDSKGIILSNDILEKYKIGESVELLLEDNYILIRPVKIVRKGWADAFKRMHQNGDDHLLIDDYFKEEFD